MTRAMWIVVCTICWIFNSISVAAKDMTLPESVRAVWDISKALRETTPTRERICINGLWRWQPAQPDSQDVPETAWGYFKVPGCWPGITDYMQKDCQTVYRHPNWKDRDLGNITAAWYERQVTIPDSWTGRRVTIEMEYLNSYAAVYIDGRRIGEARFPGGQVDVTTACVRGQSYQLSILVVAMPLKGVMLSYADTARAKEVKGTVARRGLCGDVYLVSTPPGPRIDDIRIDTSIRKREIALDTAFSNLAADAQYILRATVKDDGRTVKEFTRDFFQTNKFKDGRFFCAESWMPEKLWDIHTPQNMYDIEISLLDTEGHVLDTSWTTRFGFREFWIDGRDFYLNGTRLFLSTVPLDNALVGAALATYEATRESLERLKTFGINFVYTHNYGCAPGSHLSYAEVLRAADDVGMLVSFSQPHFSHYDWQDTEADCHNGYTEHAAFYVRAAQNHPAVIMYSMSHNATGYSEDMNPYMIDGVQDARDTWALRNVKNAVQAEAIVNRLDPSRIVYHHASGNLNAMHVINFYPNFVPIQEMSDWFEHWATEGIKPVFLCEYGAPFTWDWAMYRGWYQGKREFGSAVVPWEFCLAEWNAQFFGDTAFDISEREKQNLRWEARQFSQGQRWHRWDYPYRLGSRDLPEREPVFARYFQDNWRAFRTWGVSANSPWEHGILFKLRPDMERNRRETIDVDWDNLQRPGFSPDYIQERYERMDLAYERNDWVPTAGVQALIQNNGPVLAYIAGKPESFTSKDHIFQAGEMIEKQIIVINNSRVPTHCQCTWSLDLPEPITGQTEVTVQTGQQARIPISFIVPKTLEPGTYRLHGEINFETGQRQEDDLAIHIIAPKPNSKVQTKVALFDPKGQTANLLDTMNVAYDTVNTEVNLRDYDVLILGKEAMTTDSPAPDLRRVRDGLKVLMFEQTTDVLTERLGFRATEYGLRRVFPRIQGHPALSHLHTEHLQDWRGQATILPGQLKYERDPKFNGAPTVNWCGVPVTRLWRCGCRGNVASVLIEKPTCGDFLPIVDGGFSLQYSPLLEYHQGKGMILFCQMDVTGRTETDPAAQILAANIIEYVCTWKPTTRKDALYFGEPAGKEHLQATGVQLADYDGGPLNPDHVLIVTPGSKATPHVETFLEQGGHILAIGLNQEQIDTILPSKISVNEAEYINAYFDRPDMDSSFAGIGPADVHNRVPRVIPLVSGSAESVGNGVLATASNGHIVFCQLTPWQFQYRDNFGLKRTYRRTSFLLARLLSNLGVRSDTPLLSRFSEPVKSGEPGRWLEGLYLDQPEEWDDPYRFFRW